MRGPFGSAAPAIAEALEQAGYAWVAKPVGFVVTGRFGPLRDGEVERARAWGTELAAALDQGAGQRRATSSWPRTPAGPQRSAL